MKKILVSFVLLCGMCSMSYADEAGRAAARALSNKIRSMIRSTYLEEVVLVPSYQMPCSPSDFDIKPYVDQLKEAIRARDALRDLDPDTAVTNYNQEYDRIQKQIEEARKNQYRSARCIVSRKFHMWLEPSSHSKHIKDRVTLSSPDGAWELDTPLDTVCQKRSDKGGKIEISPRRDGNNVIIDLQLQCKDVFFHNIYFYGIAKGQYKLTEGYINQKVNEEFPFLWQRVNDAVTVQWK